MHRNQIGKTDKLRIVATFLQLQNAEKEAKEEYRRQRTVENMRILKKLRY